MIGTGMAHSVHELVKTAFEAAGLNWRNHVVEDLEFTRPADIAELRADASKAHQELGWKPTVPFEELVAMMVEADLRRLRDGDPLFL